MENQIIKIDDSQLSTLKSTFFRGADENQIALALRMANHYGLDPFLKEIYFVPSVGIMVGRDGYLAAARRTGELESFRSGVIYEGDALEVDYQTPEIRVGTTTASLAAGKPVAGWCIVGRRSCVPVLKLARFAEYNRGGQAWGKYPSAMIQKVAESMALRAAFGISGAVPADEIESESRSAETAKNVTPGRVIQRNAAPAQTEKEPVVVDAVLDSEQDQQEKIIETVKEQFGAVEVVPPEEVQELGQRLNKLEKGAYNRVFLAALGAPIRPLSKLEQHHLVILKDLLVEEIAAKEN